MIRISVLFLRTVVLLMAAGAIAFLLGEPHLEGRNVNATLFQIYFQDPFLAYAYVGSIAFFVALHRTFRLLGYADRGKAFSPESIADLRTIKVCALILIGFVVVGELVFILPNTSDDRAGGVAMGVFVSFGALVMATTASLFEQLARNARDQFSSSTSGGMGAMGTPSSSSDSTSSADASP